MDPSDQVKGGIYYPSLVVNFQIRFDEGANLIVAPKTNAQIAQEGGTKAPQTVGPSLLAYTGKDNLSKVIAVVPKAASVEIPGYRVAGTFNLDLEFRDFPIDPRIVRALGVSVHLGAVLGSDWADGIGGKIVSGRRLSVVEPTDDNVVLTGTADTINVEHSERGSTVKIEGRDLRGIFLDTAVNPEVLKAVDLQQPLDKVVGQLLNELHALGGNLVIETDPTEWPGGALPSPYVKGDQTRPTRDASDKEPKNSGKGDANSLKYWDLITQWCFLCGAIPYFVGSKLRLRPVRSLYDARQLERQFDRRFPTPFSRGYPRDLDPPFVGASESFNYRRMVYGRDLQRLRIERKLGGVKVPVIECYSIDSDNTAKGLGNRLVSAQYPAEGEDNARSTDMNPSGEQAKTEVIRIPVPGIKSKARLLEIAKSLHAEVGRQEIGGSAETQNLASFGGGNEDPDLLKLRPGDPVEFRVDASSLRSVPATINELTNHEGRSFEEEVKEVAQRLGGDENLARVLVATSRDEVNQLVRTFRVNNVKFNWSAEGGIGIAFDFQNFVETRYTDSEERVSEPNVASGAFWKSRSI